MKKQFLIIEVWGEGKDHFITDPTTMEDLLMDLYEDNSNETKEAFFEDYDVYEIKGELLKISL